MTDILAKATVEFGQPLISLNFRERPEEQEGISSVWRARNDTVFQINLLEPIAGDYEVDIYIWRHYYKDWNMRNSVGDKRISNDFISRVIKASSYFTFEIVPSSLNQVKLNPNETLLITFIVRKESEEPKVSTIRDAVCASYAQFEDLEDRFSNLEATVGTLIEQWKPWVEKKLITLSGRIGEIKEAEKKHDKLEGSE